MICIYVNSGIQGCNYVSYYVFYDKKSEGEDGRYSESYEHENVGISQGEPNDKAVNVFPIWELFLELPSQTSCIFQYIFCILGSPQTGARTTTWLQEIWAKFLYLTECLGTTADMSTLTFNRW